MRCLRFGKISDVPANAWRVERVVPEDNTYGYFERAHALSVFQFGCVCVSTVLRSLPYERLALTLFQL